MISLDMLPELSEKSEDGQEGPAWFELFVDGHSLAVLADAAAFEALVHALGAVKVED